VGGHLSGGGGPPAAGPTLLLAAGQGGANAAALAWRNDLAARRLAPATIARRLAALRGLCKLARVLGITTWALGVEAPGVETLRDTRGPGKDGFQRLLAELEVRADRKGLRDRAILHLLFDLALRRGEVCSLDLCHLDLEADAVEVLGKGRSRRERLSLPGPTHEALAAWVQVRGQAPGPLFTSCDRAGKGDGRLTGGAVYAVVRGLGQRAGLVARPHGLRHAAITEALDRT